MSLKTCTKCGEEVDEAKAFCPGCGNSFVIEQKNDTTSEFDKYAGTVNVSKTMFKMMLSEMGLDTSKRAEKPVNPEPSKAPAAEVSQSTGHASPIVASSPRIEPPPQIKAENVKDKRTAKWLIFLLVGILFLTVIGVAIASLLYYFYFS